MNNYVEVFVWTYDFNDFAFIPGRLAGPYGNTMLNFLISCIIVFQNSYPTLHSYSLFIRVLVALILADTWYGQCFKS